MRIVAFSEKAPGEGLSLFFSPEMHTTVSLIFLMNGECKAKTVKI